MLIILSLFTEGQLRKEKRKKKKKKRKKKGKKKKRGKKKRVLDYCCLEALDTNVSMVLASMTSGAGHSSLWWFSAGMSSAGTGLCSVSGCENCWLCLRRWRGGVGWSLFLIPSVEWQWCCGFCTALPTELSFFGLEGTVHFRSSITAEALDVLLYCRMTKHTARRWMASMWSICCWVYGSQTVHAYSRAGRTYDL